MNKQLTSMFRFDNYKVDGISYNLNPKFKHQEPVDLNFSLQVCVEFDTAPLKGEVGIRAVIFENAQENNYPFSLEVVLTGFFSTENDMAPEKFHDFCKVNGVTALFPFLRSIIADITRVANQEPLILPLINIRNLIEQQEKTNNKCEINGDAD